MRPLRCLPLIAVLLSATAGAAPPPGGPCQNGLYMHSKWMSEDASGIELSRLRDIFVPARITDLYLAAESRYLTLAAPRVEKLRHALRPIGEPAPRVHAWLGERVCAEGEPIRGCTSLTRTGNAPSIVRLAELAWGAGFDAFHLDLEPVPDGDGVFLDLLDLLRAAKPKGKLLSLAGYMLSPADLASSRVIPKGMLQWSERYYREVLKRVDQVMAMNYDTGLGTSKEYASWTEAQLAELYRLTREEKVELRFGVPAFERGRGSLFNPKAENLKSSSDGARAALRRILGKSGRAECPPGFGFALFREGEISDEEWTSFTEMWGRGKKKE